MVNNLELENIKDSIFEEYKKFNEYEQEYWSAIDFYKILDYQRWESFINVIDKAKEACKNSNQNDLDHFRRVTKMVGLGSSVQRDIGDLELSRFACYLIVQNADPSKRIVALGQTYFAIQNGKQESLKSKVGLTISPKVIEERIFQFRNNQVMIDSDLAEFYHVETKVLNQAIKRNIDRFPEEFCFQLTKEEFELLKSQNVTLKKNALRSQNVTSEMYDLRSQNVTSNKKGGRRYLPYVFTEQGVAMLSAVLKSETAIKVSIQIMKAFVGMRRFLVSNTDVFRRIDNLELNQDKFKLESDKNFDKIFKALDKGSLPAKQGIFYDGQFFDAYSLISDIIRTAKSSIIIIDNYADDSVLQMLTKRLNTVRAVVYTQFISKTLALDLSTHNSQYEQVEIKELKTSHDRFMIIDNKDVYHFGASLKDAGKKWFAFSLLEIEANDILNKL